MLLTDNSSRDVSNCDSSNGRVEMELGLRTPQQEVEQMCENVFLKMSCRRRGWTTHKVKPLKVVIDEKASERYYIYNRSKKRTRNLMDCCKTWGFRRQSQVQFIVFRCGIVSCL